MATRFKQVEDGYTCDWCVKECSRAEHIRTINRNADFCQMCWNDLPYWAKKIIPDVFAGWLEERLFYEEIDGYSQRQINSAIDGSHHLIKKDVWLFALNSDCEVFAKKFLDPQKAMKKAEIMHGDREEENSFQEFYLVDNVNSRVSRIKFEVKAVTEVIKP